MRRRWAALLAPILVIGLAGCGGGPMSVSDARAFYEHATCPVVAAYGATQAALADGLPQAKIAARKAAAAYRHAAVVLRRPPGPWPDDVRPLMPPFIAQLGRQAGYFDRMRQAVDKTAAVDLPFPDGSAVSVPVEKRLEVPSTFTCPG